MEKHIIPQTYLFGDNRVEIMPYFLYEVSVYKIAKDMVALKASRFYKSNKALTIKKDPTIKKYKDHYIIRYINVLGVTKDFVEESNLPTYESKKKSIKRKKKGKNMLNLLLTLLPTMLVKSISL